MANQFYGIYDTICLSTFPLNETVRSPSSIVLRWQNSLKYRHNLMKYAHFLFQARVQNCLLSMEMEQSIVVDEHNNIILLLVLDSGGQQSHKYDRLILILISLRSIALPSTHNSLPVSNPLTHTVHNSVHLTPFHPRCHPPSNVQPCDILLIRTYIFLV